MTVKEATVAEFFHVEGGAVSFHVFVLKQAYNQKLRNFVIYYEDTYEFVISETVPEDFRKYVLNHEIYCQIAFEGEEGSCAHATREEYLLVPEEKRSRYARFR